MALVSIDVRTVQQALTHASADMPVIPSPGPIDGVWGQRTLVSLDIYRSLVKGDRTFRIEAQLNAIQPRAVAILIEDWVAVTLRSDAIAYRALPPGREVPTTIASRVRTMANETVNSLPGTIPSAAAIVGRGTTPSWVVPGLLGLGAAVLLVGGGYWLYTRSRRRRR